MLHKDYLLRPLYMMLDEITSRFSTIQVKRIKDLDQYLDDLYLKYIDGNRNYFIKKDIEEILNDKELNDNQITLLAELFYRDALIQTDNKIKKKLLQKAKAIFNHQVKQSDTFSFETANKIVAIENLIIEFCLN